MYILLLILAVLLIAFFYVRHISLSGEAATQSLTKQDMEKELLVVPSIAMTDVTQATKLKNKASESNYQVLFDCSTVHSWNTKPIEIVFKHGMMEYGTVFKIMTDNEMLQHEIKTVIGDQNKTQFLFI